MKIENLCIEDMHTWQNKNSMGVHFEWSASIGFGELQIYSTDGIHWKADTETLCNNEDKEFIKMIFDKWVEEMEVEG